MVRALVILLVSVALTAFSASRPAWNFDAIGYAAVARKWLGESPEAVHQGVYADVREVAPKRWAEDIAAGSEYRKTLSKSPENFAEQFGFYVNKPLYVGLVALAFHLGVNSIAAAFLVSALAYCVLAASLLLWITSVVRGALGWMITISFLLSPPLREIASLATPDALASCLAFGGAYLILRTRNLRTGIIVLASTVLARPDGLFVVAAVLGWLAARKHDARIAGLAALAIGAATSIGVTALSGAHAWSVLFTHTFVRRVISTQDVQDASSISVASYIKTLARGLNGDFVQHPSSVLLFAAWSMIMTSFARYAPQGQEQDFVGLLRAGWIAIALHVLAFPMLADRFFVPQYLFVMVFAAELLNRWSHTTPMAGPAQDSAR